MTIKETSEPSAEPVDLAFTKNNLRVMTADDDADILAQIKTARQIGEEINGRMLAQRTFERALDAFPADDAGIVLGAPLVSVDSFTYTDSDGVVHTMVEDTDFVVDTMKEPGVVYAPVNGLWPTATLARSSAIRIEFTAGYEAAECPEIYKRAILRLVAHWYFNRTPYIRLRETFEVRYDITQMFERNRLIDF